MIVVDVNVLIAAFRADHPHHSLANPWFSSRLAGPEHIIVLDAVWTGFLRIVTHPAVFLQPSNLAEAAKFIKDVCAAPAYTTMPAPPDAPARLASLCLESQSTGNLVPDAWIAMCALASGSDVATFDRDFRRFDALRLLTPVAAGQTATHTSDLGCGDDPLPSSAATK